MNCFDKIHPILLFSYLVCVIFLGMLILHPIYLVVSVCCSFISLWLVQGNGAFRRIALSLPMIIIITLINPLFNTDGITILFMLFNRPFTLEALLYGFILAMLCVTVINWFGVYEKIITTDKFIYLFGRIFPSVSLLFSMVMRFIPLYKRRFTTLMESGKYIGKGIAQEQSKTDNLLNSLTLLSAMLSISLENAVITSDSMKSRGYGLKGKTSYSIYKWKHSDTALLCIFLFSLFISIIFILLKTSVVEIIPIIKLPPFNIQFYCGILSYTILLLLPAIYAGGKELKWSILKSKI